MPRRRQSARRRRPVQRPMTQFTYMGSFAAGKGQINISPTNLGMDPSRSYQPCRAQIQICLSGAIAVCAAEPVMIKLYNWAVQSDVAKMTGPYLIGTLPRTINVRFPSQTPTQFGTAAMDTRKLMSFYDFGTDSKLGLQVVVRLWAFEGPNLPSGSAFEDLPEKLELLDL